MNPLSRDLAVLHCVHDFAPVAEAVSAREETRDARRPRPRVNGDPAAVVGEAGQGGEKVEQGFLPRALTTMSASMTNSEPGGRTRPRRGPRLFGRTRPRPPAVVATTRSGRASTRNGRRRLGQAYS